MPVALKEAGGDSDLKLGCQLAHCDDGRVLSGRASEREIRLILFAAEIGAAKQFGRQDNLAPARSGLLHQFAYCGDIHRLIFIAQRQLESGQCDSSHQPLSVIRVSRPS